MVNEHIAIVYTRVLLPNTHLAEPKPHARSFARTYKLPIFIFYIYIYIFFFAYYRHIAARESETLKFRIEVSYYEVSLTKIFIH